MNRYDFEYIIDINDDSHRYTVLAQNYLEAYNKLKELIEPKYDNFRVDIYKNVQLPIAISDFNCIVEDKNFGTSKLVNSTHKELITFPD